MLARGVKRQILRHNELKSYGISCLLGTVGIFQTGRRLY